MNEIISMSTISTAVPAFKNHNLQKATESLIRIYTNASQYADSKNREIAKILASVSAEESYKDDGFDSVADYAEKTFGIRRVNAYSLASAGAIYNDESVDPRLKDLSPSKLAEVAKIPAEKIAAELDSGRISVNTSQKDLREIAKSYRDESGKVEVLKSYRAIPMDHRFDDFFKTEPLPIETWGVSVREYFLNILGAAWFEEIKLPKGKLDPVAPKSTYHRILYTSDVISVVVYFDTPPKATQNKPKHKFTREELQAMLSEMDNE